LLDEIRGVPGLERVTGPTLDVLEVLLDAHSDDAELHGWAIVKTAKLSGPTVYGVLDRLEDAGWITARWEEQSSTANRPRRRYYRLTPTGATEARAGSAAVHRPVGGCRTIVDLPPRTRYVGCATCASTGRHRRRSLCSTV